MFFAYILFDSQYVSDLVLYVERHTWCGCNVWYIVSLFDCVSGTQKSKDIAVNIGIVGDS